MCGIAAAFHLERERFPALARSLGAMNDLQRHRGPDGVGLWMHPDAFVGLGHRRLSVIDAETGHQPMCDALGNAVTQNGEIYNYGELRARLEPLPFRTASDTEVLLHAYGRWGLGCLDELRGMFAFALWDEARQELVCARDRCGIKPLYYTVVDAILYVASEMKALMPFLPTIETDPVAYQDYRAFQCCLNGRTLFKGVHELRPGHWLRAHDGDVHVGRYWALPEPRDEREQAPEWYEERLREQVEESVATHLVSDVPVGMYLSGGLDSSIVATQASRTSAGAARSLLGVVGAFPEDASFDESPFARQVAASAGFPLHRVEIGERDFVDNMRRLVYHLDVPVAGPGALPQFVVSREASTLRKVLLGGQGGDEIFGGYVRYLAAMDAEGANTLAAYGDYSDMLRRLRWSPRQNLEGRYFTLIDRRNGSVPEGPDAAFDRFLQLFRQDGTHGHALDRMMRFEFHSLLPALLHVEDRMSMAHGLESRVPLLDHRLVELGVGIPAGLKVRNGVLKSVLRDAMGHLLPASVSERRDKMGFPVPLNRWLARPGPARDFVLDLLTSRSAQGRDLVDHRRAAARIGAESAYGRAAWGHLCLELWQQEFHDRAHHFRRLLEP